MKASEAKILVKKALDRGINIQRKHFLDRVKKVCSVGNTFLLLDDIYYRYDEDDYLWMESLGYKVTRPEKKWYKSVSEAGGYFFYTQGRVDW